MSYFLLLPPPRPPALALGVASFVNNVSINFNQGSGGTFYVREGAQRCAVGARCAIDASKRLRRTCEPYCTHRRASTLARA